MWCGAASLCLVLLLVFLTGPPFCILEARNSPFFSAMLKYTITLSFVISFGFFISGVLTTVDSIYLSHHHDIQNLTDLHLRPAPVIAMLSLSAAVNFAVTLVMTFLCCVSNCGSCFYAIVLSCCLVYNLGSNCAV